MFRLAEKPRQMSIVSRFRYTFAMTDRMLSRDGLWETATVQHGFVTAQ